MSSRNKYKNKVKKLFENQWMQLEILPKEMFN